MKKTGLKPALANPLIWGAWGGIVCGVVAFIAQTQGELKGGTVWGYGMGGFFWIWIVANIRNWLATRPLK